MHVYDGLMVYGVLKRNFSNINEGLCVLLYRLVTKNSPQHLINKRVITLKKRDDVMTLVSVVTSR